MNQPYNPYSGANDPSVYPAQPPQAPYPYGAQPGQYNSYVGGGQRPPQPPGRSKAALLLATGLAVALAIGVTLFLVLRPEETSADGGGETPGKSSAGDVTKVFFAAVDAQDEAAMKANARGDILDDIADILNVAHEDVTYSTGDVVDDVSKQVDGVEIAIVVWKVVDLPKGDPADEPTLMVALLDEGEGYDICHVDSTDGRSITTMMTEWEDDFAQTCGYSK